MRIVIPGGSGQIGQILARSFVASGDDVVVLSRGGNADVGRGVAWDGRTLGDWAAEVDGADVVINLAGRSVDCRYDRASRRQIMESRVDSTRAVGQAIAQAANPPPTWLQMSTATIYADRRDPPHDERSDDLGGNEPNVPDMWAFSIDVAKAWEEAARAADTSATRLVLMRTAMVMSPDPGGVFRVLLRLVRLGLGGSVAGGQQRMSWIHDADFVAAVQHLIATPSLDGPINLAAPGPLPQAEFMRSLRRAWGQRIGLPATRWMLEVGAFVLRTESELILKSRSVVSAALPESGFVFRHPNWPAAAEDLVRRTRGGG